MTTHRILITGVAGQVGGAMLRQPPAGVAVVAAGRDVLDLSRPEAIAPMLDAIHPDIVVNCAAYTAVDLAEREPDLAFAVNAEAPAALARWCQQHGRLLVHVSTDYVFPGDGNRPYGEDAPLGPISVYGASKAEGEQRIREACARHVILRTAWVYAAEGRNFVRTMLRLGAERETLDVVADQRGCPTAAASIAAALWTIVDRLGNGTAPATGTYHFVDAGETTWCGFADAIFARAGKYWGRRPAVRPITTDQYPTPARRPRYSVLDTTRIRQTFGIVPSAWEVRLEQTMREIFSGHPTGVTPTLG